MPISRILTEKEVLAQFESRKNIYAPLQVVSVERESVALGYRPAAKVTLALQKRNISFLVEVKTRTAPK